MLNRLAGQVCLVTGGAQGIGAALCRLLSQRDARVFVADISREHLRAADQVQPARPAAGSIHYSCCDVTQWREVEAWIRTVHDRTGRIDVLVNNAAYIRWEDVALMPVEDAQRIMRVAYDGMVFCVHAVLPEMLRAGRGHIVNMGSVADQMFLFGGYAAYAAAKAAINAFSQVLQIELRNSGVRVTLIRPGLVAGTSLFGQQVDASRMPRIADLLPLTSADTVARQVLRMLEKPREILTIPWQYRVLAGLYQAAPRLSRWLSRIGGRCRHVSSRLSENREP